MRSRVGLTTLIAVVATTLLAAGCSDEEPAERTGNAARRTAPPTTTTSSTTTSSPTSTTLVPVAGSSDVGDPTTPGAGNGGYDVEHYDLIFDVAADTGVIMGTSRMRAVATQDLSAFNLDLQGFDIDAVLVDDSAAGHQRFDDELTVTAPAPIPTGATFTTIVRYRGLPRPVDDPSAPGEIGWLTGRSGSFIVAEPVGAKAVFPGNDHPSDKATFTITVIAPTGVTALANGVPKATSDDGRRTTTVFDVPQPMATYLIQVAIGDYVIASGTDGDGMPLRSAAPTARTSIDLDALNRRAADQIAWFEEQFGEYPFDTYGLLIADAPPEFALETQTLSIFPTLWFLAETAPVDAVTAHELAHQWFGNDVSLSRWSDIWLNEGFATYAEWMWNDHVGTEDLAARASVAMGDAGAWRSQYGPVASPPSDELFNPNVYDGGALVLHALRLRIGDPAFFDLLRRWIDRYGGANGTTADFEALAAQVSGQDLTAFFEGWLHSTTVPALN